MAHWYLKSISLIIGFALFTGESRSSSPSAALPGKHNSQRLEELFRRVLAGATGFKISFGTLDRDSPYLGRTTYLYDEIRIELREGLSGEVRENALAHELLHAELKTQGFASNYRVFPDNPFLNELSERLIDCVNHQVIDPRMRAAGFKPELIWKSLVQNTQHPHFTADLNNTGFQRLNGLIVYCLSCTLMQQRQWGLSAL